MVIVRIQSTNPFEATASHRFPAQTGHWTHWTLDTRAPPQTTMAANTCVNACVTVEFTMRELKGGQNKWATQNKGKCPICVRVEKTQWNFHLENPNHSMQNQKLVHISS